MAISTARAGLAMFACCLIYGQTVEKGPSFDAASIKPHANSGGGGRRGAGDSGAEGTPPAPPRIASGGGQRFMPGRVVGAPIGVSGRKISSRRCRNSSD